MSYERLQMASYPQPIPDYTKHLKQIEKVDDVYEGSDTSKKYLRKFPRENKDDYKERQEDATLDNFVKRTIENRKNIVFRKSIDLTNITNNTLLEWCEESIDNKGTSLNEFAKNLMVNIDKDGFSYIFTDSPKIDDDVQMTDLQQRELKIRPYLVNIKRKDLFYWENDAFGNFEIIAFNESYEEREEGDIFGFETKTQIKAYFNDGRVIIFRDGANGKAIYKEYNREVKEILIEKVGTKDIPIFYDMAKINLKQFNRESEKSNYVRIGACPFPIFYGSIDEKAPKTLSITQGLSFGSKTENGFEWAELKGTNYEIIKTELLELSEQMKADSISFATESNIKTATQVERDSTVDESKLTDMATIIEDGLNKSIENLGKLKTDLNTENQNVVVNKDFSTNRLNPEQQDRLVSLYVQNVISKDRLTKALEKGEVLELLGESERNEEETRLLSEGVGK